MSLLSCVYTMISFCIHFDFNFNFAFNFLYGVLVVEAEKKSMLLYCISLKPWKE